MTYDLRYDGPDLEGEASSRTANVLMGTTMMVDGLTAGRQSRKQAAAGRTAAQEAQALQGDQMVWRDTPGGAELTGLADDAIAHRWAACAAHPDQPDANDVRGRLEAELTRRDPETMRDYRSWRNAVGLPPGAAMHRALQERNARLWQEWKPLTEPGVDAMGADEVLDRWAAAHAAHEHPGIAEDLEQARAVGEARLRKLDPGRADAWKAMQAQQPSPVTDLGSRPGLSPADAAARTAGRPVAFLPSTGGASAGWGSVATKGVPVLTTAVRTATVANPAGPALATAQMAASAAQHTQHVLNRGMKP